MPRVQQFSNLSSVGVLKPCCTIKGARTRLYIKMHPYKGRFTGLVVSSLFLFWPGCITNMSG